MMRSTLLGLFLLFAISGCSTNRHEDFALALLTHEAGTAERRVVPCRFYMFSLAPTPCFVRDKDHPE